MARKSPSYRFVFFKGGKRLSLKKLAQANSFEIYYGKRRVLSRTAFPKAVRRVGQRHEYLSDAIKQIERKHLNILKRRRARAKKLREIELAKKAQKTVRRKLSRPVKKPSLTADQRQYVKESVKASAGLLIFNKAYGVEPATATRANVIDTMIIPIEPESKDYFKRVVDKTMWKQSWGDYHLAILDFTLDDASYIPMTAETFNEGYRDAYLAFLPHVVRYFEAVKKSSNHFILRVKFLNRWDLDDAFDDYGISYTRQEIRNTDQIMNLFRMTFTRLFGDPLDPETTKGKLRRNYLEGDKTIFIKGFTLEATTIP